MSCRRSWHAARGGFRRSARPKGALEAEACARAEQACAQAREKLAKRARREAETGQECGRAPQVPEPEQAKPTAQRNLTDPDSRILQDMATKGFEQAYNVQAAVDGAAAQIIVATAVRQDANDKQQLKPLLEKVKENCADGFPRRPRRMRAPSTPRS